MVEWSLTLLHCLQCAMPVPFQVHVLIISQMFRRPGFLAAPSECEDSNNARLQVLTEEQLSLFREDFSAVDTDKDGQISEHEIAVMVRKQLGLAPTKRQLNALMRWVSRRSKQCCFEFVSVYPGNSTSTRSVHPISALYFTFVEPECE